LGALQVMGLWGIFFGPIVASCLYALVQIFNAELKESSVNAAVKGVAPPGEASTAPPADVKPTDGGVPAAAMPKDAASKK
jgi:hypothetical protein